MTSNLTVRSALIVFVLVVSASSLFAQRAEIYPNAGFFWADTMSNGQRFKSEGVYGLKGGVFLNENAQLEGSFGYMNHWQMKQPPNPFNPSFGIVQPTIHGLLYDVNGTYNFGQRQFLNARISPYLTVGGGGLTTVIKDATSTFVEGD